MDSYNSLDSLCSCVRRHLWIFTLGMQLHTLIKQIRVFGQISIMSCVCFSKLGMSQTDDDHTVVEWHKPPININYYQLAQDFFIFLPSTV